MISTSPEQTFQFGKKYASELKPGDVVLLKGDLGSGKTQFVKGICSFFKVKENVNSPTFILVNEYTPELSAGVSKIFHFDFYRIKKFEELKEIGFNEYLRLDTISLIEWPDIILNFSLPPTQKVNFTHGLNPNERKIEIN